ncbi:hypothetical protein GM415_12395 [Pseudodesulfovibrio cashew]|uniref:Uncharacterized protein n=1 Tax=Pseudodesulfovibrio cashew TaxID=2678688 RepID=A0A6I6JDJ1_9BACT|nr:glycosyltransferase family 39 protein [Pseudodesulfovibrio cashew]QGY40895.1 hypothetical protein GM415_12395 [Pseudodesulfovibrio cashew]
MPKTALIPHKNRTILLLFILSVAVRIITAEYVDIGGDNCMRWDFASSLQYGIENLQWSHHTARLIITMPLWGLLELFGNKPALYYVLPILSASVGSVFMYLIGAQLKNERFGIIVAITTILFPQLTQSGSQLWPSIFQFTFLAIAIWAILAWHERKNTGYILMAACAFYLIWSARLTAVYVFPGLALLIFLPSRKVKPLILFAVSVGVLCLLEWAFFWWDTGNVMGRIGVVTQTAIARHESLSITDYLLRFIEFKKLRGLIPVLILTIISAIATLKTQDQRWKAISILYLGYVFLLVYMVAGVNPIKPATWPSSRYWMTAAPFGLMLLCNSLFELRFRFPRLATSLFIILFIAFAGFSAKKIQSTNAIVQVTKNEQVVAPLLASKTPIILEWKPWNPNYIEGLFYTLFNVEIKPKGIREDHIKMAMKREKNRLVWLFLHDKTQIASYLDGELIRIDKLKCLYVPPGGDSTSPPGATIHFDRKNSYAQKLLPTGKDS